MKTYHLNQLTLGPAFHLHTQETFLNYVHSLKQEKAIDKPAPKLRIKKPIVTHDLNFETGLCKLCNSKVRNVKAKCSEKKVKKDLTANSSMLQTDETQKGAP